MYSPHLFYFSMNTALDFSKVETDNCKTLGIVDESYYAPTPVISSPELTIWIPGFSNPVIVSFIPRKVNIINSNDLGLTTAASPDALSNIPDGVYKVKYTMTPATTYSVEKIFFRVCKLNCRYQNALLKLDIFNCDDVQRKARMNKLREIELLIASAVAAANVCNTVLAYDLYHRAERELERLKIDKC